MLREDQIQRYGRQILLREVGGRGQQKLLERGVHVTGDGPGLAEAVAYLAAGGSPITTSIPPSGFLAGTTLDALNPDAEASVPRFLTIGARVEALTQPAGGSQHWRPARQPRSRPSISSHTNAKYSSATRRVRGGRLEAVQGSCSAPHLLRAYRYAYPQYNSGTSCDRFQCVGCSHHRKGDPAGNLRG